MRPPLCQVGASILFCEQRKVEPILSAGQLTSNITNQRWDIHQERFTHLLEMMAAA